jgi:hypothetical protein
MKKALLFLPALLAAIGLSAAVPAGAGVSCSSNIFDGSAAYGGPGQPSTTLSGTIQTGVDQFTTVPSCKSVSYNATISYTLGGTHVVQVAAQKGDGTNFFLRFSFSPVSSDNGAFCVALTSSKGNTIQDTAPSTADPDATPTPVYVGSASPNGYSCGSSGWVAINVDGSSGGGASGFVG